MWYDNDGTILIVDWAEANTVHNYQDSFNLQTLGTNNNVSVDDTTFTAQTKYSSGGNVKIQALSRPGQTAAKGPLTFVTNQASGNFMDPAYRFTVNQSGTFVCFVTLITAYNGTTAPNTTATLMNTPVAGGMVRVQLTKNGVSQEVDFTPTVLQHLNATASSRGTCVTTSPTILLRQLEHGLRRSRHRRSHVRHPRHQRPMVHPADHRPTRRHPHRRRRISIHFRRTRQPRKPRRRLFRRLERRLEIRLLRPHHQRLAHANGRQQRFHRPLSFADLQPTRWRGHQLLQPRQRRSRSRHPAGICIHHRNHWDSTGDVGRFSSLLLDPNRPTATKWAIGYEDTSNGNYKYALQGLFNGGTQIDGYTNYTVDNLQYAGGYVSLAYYDSKSNDDERYKPAMTYYDAANSAVRFAISSDRGSTWSTQAVATTGIQGLYTNLYFDSSGRANILYFNRSNNDAIHAILTGKKWSFTTVSSGGRELHVSLAPGGEVAYRRASTNPSANSM